MKKKIAKIILLCLFLAILLAFGLSFLFDAAIFPQAGILLTAALIVVYFALWR